MADNRTSDEQSHTLYEIDKLSITDDDIRALNAEHSTHDEDSCPSGRAAHVGALIATCVALGVLSEAYPGARIAARARCAEILNARNGR